MPTTQQAAPALRLKHLADRVVHGGPNQLAFSCPVLEDMYGTRTVQRPDGETIAVDGLVTIPHANALHQTVKDARAEQVLELGMAYGGSTLTILSALEELGGDGELISVDPAQTSYWDGIGLHNVERSGLGDRHRLMEEPDFLALPELLRRETAVDVAYIDGMHTFDYTLLDFFYIDRMLKVGGIVGFNDCWMPSVNRVIGYVETHRHYEEIDVGLSASFVSRDLKRMARNVATRTPKRDRYFKKLDTWEPEWFFYARF